MLEKDIENLIANYPDEFFPNEGFKLIGQQHTIEKRRIDVLFEDKHGRQIVVEVKRGILSREASGQILAYYCLLKQANPLNNYELILCANIIPQERKLFLVNAGIDCKEIGLSKITEVADKYNYTFIDDSPAYAKTKFEEAFNSSETQNSTTAISADSENRFSGVWIFQANPNRYDILNALSDPLIGNTIHWLVTRYKENIHSGHLALIWLSGSSSGIYAVCRIESAPKLMNESPSEMHYWLGEDSGEKIRVRMTVLIRLINKPIYKKELVKLPATREMTVIKAPQGTNFAVTATEWQAIARLLP